MYTSVNGASWCLLGRGTRLSPRSLCESSVPQADGSTFCDVADSWEGNTDDMFCVYSTATAATRAEGRALRKALRLRVVAAEEVTKKDTAKIAQDISKKKGLDVSRLKS